MAESLTFHFEGLLADNHQMNFYEASRFQYAAARLLVKLSQFRETGRFTQKISSKSNFDVRLSAPTEGSFNVNVEDVAKKKSDELFVDADLADLVAYVAERVIAKIDDETIKNASSWDGLDKSTGVSDINQLAESVAEKKVTVENLPSQVRDLIKRRASEIHREDRLRGAKGAISKIDPVREQKLVAMSAPLIIEMATALRNSADTLDVISSMHGKSSSVLFLDQKMAQEIETSSVDDEITPILCDVVQFNKDNGWGKVKIENGTVTIPFTIPYDTLPKIRQVLIDNMKKDLVYLQTYFVRDRAETVTRLIVVGILETPTI